LLKLLKAEAMKKKSKSVLKAANRPRQTKSRAPAKTPAPKARGAVSKIIRRKRGEQTLAAKQRLLDSLIAVIPDLVYFKDRQSRFIRINEAYIRRAGMRDVHTAPGKTDFDIFGEQHARHAYEDEQRIMATGQPMINKEEREDWPDGRVTWVTSTKVPLYDNRRKIIGIMGISRDITERKHTEEALAHERNLLRTILDVLPDYIYLKDEQSRFVVCNNRRADNNKVQTTEDLIGKTDADFFPPEQAAQFRADELAVLGGTPLIDKEEIFTRPDGSQQVILTTKLPFRDGTGKIIGVLGYGRDITARKQAEERLAAEQHLLNGLITTTPDRIYFKDRESRFIKVNEAFAHVQELSDPRMLLGKTDFDVFGEQHARQAYEDEQRIMAAGEPMIDKEEREDWPDGHVTWVTSTKLPLRDSRGKIIGIVGISRDITERKRAEESHARLAKAVEQAAESIVIADTHGTIVYANPAFEKTSGYTCAEALGQNSRLLKSGKQDAGFYRRMWDVLVHGQIWSGHFINRRKDGTLYEEEATISPVRDAAGNLVNYVAVKRDVTREVQLETQLRQSQKMEAIGQLAGGVAHDFNNILAAMMMQAEMAAMVENTPGEVQEGLHEIRAAAERAANLTRQLLLFSRRQVMQPQDLDLNEIVTSLAKMLQRIIGEDVRLQLHLHPVPLIIHADAGMLDQVLMNLAVNARDAMSQGGRLLIETSEKTVDENIARLNPEAAPGRYACISVSDTGRGIPPEVLPRIFEPFFTTKEPGKGTGLGLATVYGIVKQHQGWLKVYSEPGRGANFQIFLPASTATVADLARAAARPKPRGGTETILLVEDEPAVRTLTRAILERKGYKVLEAANGAEALNVWQEHREAVSLLLTDLVMPGGMTGQQLARQIQVERPNLKVIFISGYSAEMAGRELQLRRGESFIQKPCAPDQLLETVRQCLDG
jgi:PAS domain S-box-containing protein